MAGRSRGPSLRITATVCAFGLGELVAGWYFGFASITDHVTFWILATMIVAAATRITGGLDPSPSLVGTSIRVGLVSFALVVLCGLVLGVAHGLTRAFYVAAEAGMLGTAILTISRPGRLPIFDRPNIPAPLVGVALATAAFVAGTSLGHSPFIAYDSLSYHLFFPARWLQAHQLSIIPTPFSDEAQAYQPANGELWFLWLMLPFHGDFLARIGQFPFYVLAGATAYALSRRMGANATHAAYAAAFLFILPQVVEQAAGANVDLISSSMFLVALYLGVVAVDTDDRRDWALWGVSVGLFLGTKYLALVYLPVLLLIPVVRGLRARAVWALPGIAAFGATWYLRNWAVGGSPIFPATLTVAGVTLGKGAYTHHAMLQSFMHSTDPRLLAMAVVHAFGAACLLATVPVVGLALAVILKRRAWWPAGFVLLTPFAVVLLYAIGVGDNTDPRFLLPAVVTTVTIFPIAFGRDRRVNALLHGLLAAAIVWILVGADMQFHMSLPWYMGDWWSLRGVVARPFLGDFLALAVAIAAAVYVAGRLGWAFPVVAACTTAASLILATGAETWCAPAQCDVLQIDSAHVRLNFLHGSQWLTGNVAGTTVAYTGTNLPYPLSGSHLSNIVYYANIDRHADWRFDDYARAFRRMPGHQPSDTALAMGSGFLMSLAPATGDFDALRPRFERMSGSAEAWTANLKTLGVRYVFISALDPYEIDYVWHNAQGFPIEDEWAAADTGTFRLVYENSDVRIYQVTAR